MNFYRELLKIKDEKLEEFVKERITNKEIESTLYNEDDNIIGYCLNHNRYRKIYRNPYYHREPSDK